MDKPLRNKGLNKLLFEARLKLGLKRKEAAKKIGVSHLYLIGVEKGYYLVKGKKQDLFINFYNLPKDFFSNDLYYTVEVKQDAYEDKSVGKFLSFFYSKVFKLITIGISIVCLGMTIGGICSLPLVRGNSTEFFSNSILSTQQLVVNIGRDPVDTDKNSEFGTLVMDKRKIVERVDESKDYEYVKINFFANPKNTQFMFFQGAYYINESGTSYFLDYEVRYTGNAGLRTHMYLYDGVDTSKQLSRIVCDTTYHPNEGTLGFNFVSVSDMSSGKKEILQHGETYDKFTNLFKTNIKGMFLDINDLFVNELAVLGTTSFMFTTEMDKCMSNFINYRTLCSNLTIFGLIFFIVFVIITILSFVKTASMKKKTKTILFDRVHLTDEVAVDVTPNKEITPLKKNDFINMPIPEFVVKVVALLVLFFSSMVTFFTFMEALNFAIPTNEFTSVWRVLIANLSIMAVILLYFLKLDIYQNKKNAMFMSAFLFITGLLYYILILVLYAILGNMGSSMTDLLDSLLAYIPGNIIWAVLTFNIFTIFLFANPTFKKDSKGKRLAFRLCALIPFSYLVISSVISIGMEVAGWEIHYAVSSLLFFKAPYITVFAFLYSMRVFIYRRYTVKKLGKTNAELYQTGNLYNFNRNLMAAIIILIIGIVDIIFHFVWPNNSLGFGSNYLMLCAIPILLFYHPHIGKRNGNWDTIYNILYVFVYIAGIIAIVLAVLMFLGTI